MQDASNGLIREEHGVFIFKMERSLHIIDYKGEEWLWDYSHSKQHPNLQVQVLL